MASTSVRLPDGSEADASAVICESCGLGLDGHSCGGSAAAPTVVYSRSTGKRKDPRERPLCPHCNGPVHFSMPGGLQNTECIMRQYYVSNGTIPDPFQRLPVWTASDLIVAAEAAIRTSWGYGRMESAAGGAGTYAALRPKTGRRKAGKGEKIEDMAAAMSTPAEAPTEAPTEAPAEAPAEIVLPEVTFAAEPDPKLDTSVVDDREARRARRRELLASRAR